MDGKIFVCGLIMGMIGGALIVANSHKARQIIKDGQNMVTQKVDEVTKKTKKTQKEQD